MGPALATFGNRLYAAWKGMNTDQNNDQAIYWSSFNGSDWTPQQQLAGGTSVGPALATFGNRLYAAWKGMNTDQVIYWSSFNGTNWTPQKHLAGVGTSYGPALATFGNHLYMAWKGASNRPGHPLEQLTGPTGAPRATSPESEPASGPHSRYSATTCTWPGKVPATTRASTGPRQPEA